MYGKVSMGYAGIEVSEEGINILTKPHPLSRTCGIGVKPETDKVEQTRNIKAMVNFLQEAILDKPWVEPCQFTYYGALVDVVFLVNDSIYISVMMDSKRELLPTLLSNDSNGSLCLIKFTYEGDLMNYFFSEIRRDIEDILQKEGLKLDETN